MNMARKRMLLRNNESNKWGLTIEEMAQRKAEEDKLNDFEKISSDPPEDLDTMAKNEWKRVMPLLEDLPIAELDLSMLESYCILYSQMKHTNKDMQRFRKNMDSDDDSYKMYNKSFHNYIKLSAELRNVCSNLGMTIDSRLKIVVPTPEEKSDPIMEALRG